MTFALPRLLDHPRHLAAMVPVAGLLAYWLGGEVGLTALAAALPLAVLAQGTREPDEMPMAVSDQVITRLDATLADIGAMLAGDAGTQIRTDLGEPVSYR